MTTFSDRLSLGEQHEKRVRRELETRVFEVTPWGQGILPEQTRQSIRDTRSRFRHFPDLIASRPGELVAIDAKDGMHSAETGRYAVTADCVSFGLQYVAAFGMPLYYVFGNLGVLSPSEVHAYGTRGPRGAPGAARTTLFPSGSLTTSTTCSASRGTARRLPSPSAGPESANPAALGGMGRPGYPRGDPGALTRRHQSYRSEAGTASNTPTGRGAGRNRWARPAPLLCRGGRERTVSAVAAGRLALRRRSRPCAPTPYWEARR